MIQLRVPFTLADHLDQFLMQAALHHLKVRALKLSPEEFKDLLADPDGRDRYSDGYYREVPIHIVSPGRRSRAWM